MERDDRTSPLVRILVGVLGVAGILVGLFVLAVASFADLSSGERVLTIALAVGLVALGVVRLRLALRS
jgi:uncharacterized membrane protein HdeD (DUF308 family)